MKTESVWTVAELEDAFEQLPNPNINGPEYVRVHRRVALQASDAVPSEDDRITFVLVRRRNEHGGWCEWTLAIGGPDE